MQRLFDFTDILVLNFFLDEIWKLVTCITRLLTKLFQSLSALKYSPVFVTTMYTGAHNGMTCMLAGTKCVKEMR